MTKAIEFSELEVGQRIIISINTKDDEGNEGVSYYTGEIADLKKKGEKITVLLDEKTAKGKDQVFPVEIEDIFGLATDEVCEDELSKKAAKAYLLDEKTAGKSTDKKSSKADDDDDDKPAGKSAGKDGKKRPPKEEDSGPDLSAVPKYNGKKAEVGDRLVVNYYEKGQFGGIYKGTVNAELEDGYVGIMYDSGGKDADGWVKPDHIIGRGTERIYKKKISAEKVLQHLAGKDGKAIEAPAESPFTNNNKERFDSLDAQIVELKELLEKLLKKIGK